MVRETSSHHSLCRPLSAVTHHSMSERSEKFDWRTGAACCLAGGLCLLLPPPIQSAFRAVVQDCLQPGQTLLEPLSRLAPDQQRLDSITDNDLANSRIEELQLQLRQQKLAQAELRRQLQAAQQIGTMPYTVQPSEPLIAYSLLAARVLGREKDLAGDPSLLLDLGSTRGAMSEAFVVRGTNPVLDVGTASGISPGQPVYAGRTVLGRIERTGRWTSAVRLITDPGYTGRAQLLRESTEGPQFGAEGLISGVGDGTCRLSGIPYTEPVAVGDEVYTGGRTARFPVPMFYGRVVKATLESGQKWNIIVRPHANLDAIREVAVLRESFRSARALGQ